MFLTIPLALAGQYECVAVPMRQTGDVYPFSAELATTVLPEGWRPSRAIRISTSASVRPHHTRLGFSAAAPATAATVASPLGCPQPDEAERLPGIERTPRRSARVGG